MTTIEETEFPVEQPVERSRPAAKLMRDKFDWLLGCALLFCGPMIWLHFQDLWYRSDLKFFPLLVLVSLGLILWKRQLATHNFKRRSIASLILAALGVILLAMGAVIFSPWCATCAFVLILTSWMLERYGDQAWYELVGWTLPLWVILVLPVSYVSDATRALELQVASSAGALLDLVQVPQLVTNDMIEIRSGRLSSSSVCRGLSSPYLLLALVVVLTMALRNSIVVGLISVVSVPFWAWTASVAMLAGGIYLWEVHERTIFVPERLWMVQAVVLLLILAAVWTFQLALAHLLAPFTAYSSTSGGAHDFFNWAVLWPVRDPLRKQASLSKEEAALGSVSESKPALGIVVGAAVCCAALGGYAIYRITAEQAARVAIPWSVSSAAVDTSLVESDLPEDFGGMKRASFEVYHRPDAQFSRMHMVNWVYVADLKRLFFTVDMPCRGFYPVENEYITTLSKASEPRMTMSAPVEGLGTVLLDEVMLLDQLYGRSYLCYATLTLNEVPPFRTSFSEGTFNRSDISKSLALQPTVVSVRLFIEGVDRLTDEERQQYRDLLLEACRQLRDPLKKL